MIMIIIIIYLYDDVKLRRVYRNYSRENNAYSIGLIDFTKTAVVAVAAIETLAVSSSSSSSSSKHSLISILYRWKEMEFHKSTIVV